MNYKICDGVDVLDAEGDVWVVSGRIPFDDEDTTCVYLAKCGEDAQEAFCSALYEGKDDPEGRRKDNEAAHGADVYINILQRVATREAA